MGWDELREQTIARQNALGICAPGTDVTVRSEGIPAWDRLDADQVTLFTRMMEICAGYLEQTDHKVGWVLAALDQIGVTDNSLIIRI